MDDFRNDQWLVDKDGLNSVAPGAKYEYIIAAKRLLENNSAGRGKFYDWSLQLASKTWIDIEAFIEAFDNALRRHSDNYVGDVDEQMLANSYTEARRIVRDRDAHRT